MPNPAAPSSNPKPAPGIQAKRNVPASQVKKPGSVAPRTITSVRDDEQDEDDFNQWEAKALIKPDDQLNLTEAELKEELTRILKANNPNAPQNIVRFSHKERAFKLIPHVEQLAIHFQLDGNLIHKESEEAKRQLTTKKDAAQDEGETTRADVESVAANKADDDDDDYQKTKGSGAAGNKKLTNQFNFSERASQTYNNPYRERSTMTEPPPRINFASNATQWEIYDAYLEDFEQQQKNKEVKKVGKPAEKKVKKSNQSDQADEMVKVSKAAKILERMVNQNTFDDIAQDFKYYEDDADEFRDQDGTLLPLWKFSFERSKKLSVTSLAWNKKYADLFVISYGNYDFLKQTKGLILLYSLKNPSYPELVYSTECGVMSIDIHSDYPNLICAGFYDGSVAVFNTADSSTEPKYTSSTKNGKHTDPVWQVKWQKDDLDGNMNFFSVSSDGRVVCWILSKSELLFTDIVSLNNENLVETTVDGNGAVVSTLSCGTCFDFNKQQDQIFLVCTEEGKVHKCSKAYTNQFLDTTEAHHMAVYSVAWNSFHPKIYLTCSADWTVKIWDHTFKDPLFTYDLGSAVGDATWAPYSSTVFAAVTADGKVFVFDLNVNKYEPICEQIVVQKKKTKLTHVAFNSHYPIIIVGDDRGNVTSLKLSPNLRKRPKAKKGQEDPKGPEYEIPKLEKIINLVRDPDEIKRRSDEVAAAKS